MKRIVDLIGVRFGRLVVEDLFAVGRTRWSCRCDCGSQVNVLADSLKNGETQSCGCFQRERIVEAKTTHGHSRPGKVTPTYRSWSSMHRRCTNPNSKDWYLYGARGIRVCQRWQSFELFLADMGERPEGRTIDRKNSNGNYTPRNCRWATASEQRINQRRKQPTHGG